MKHQNKVRAKRKFSFFLLSLLSLLTIHFNTSAQVVIPKPVQQIRDTPPPGAAKDSSLNLNNISPRKAPGILEEKRQVDSSFLPVIDTFSFKKATDSLDQPVVYHADDSMVLDVPSKKMYLYGKISSVKYDVNDLSAPVIEYDQTSSLVKAVLAKDSTGRVISYPYYKSGGAETVSDTIIVNMRTGKGITKGTYTKQGEMFVYGERFKKVDTATFYALRTRFTTCNLDTPHFAFIAKQVKFVNKKWAYTGPVHLEFEGVPIPAPAILPFGIFPLTEGRRSGLLPPTFTANQQLGFTLNGIGYYKILSPVWDVVTRGSLYSYGSFTANVNPRYYRRYKYQGNFSLAYQKIKPLDSKGDQTFKINWSHNADTKSRPGVNFAASVDAGSSKYNSQVPNAPRTNFTNQLNSSITYSKVWKNRPYNLALSANHNQNTVSRLININLPDAVFNVNTLYPFRRSDAAGDLAWYENLGIGYSGNARSFSYFYDTARAGFNQIANNLQYGAIHRVPITLSLPPLGPLQVSPSVSYEEKWYQQRVRQFFNTDTKTRDTVLQRGLYTARQMSFGLSLTTRIFGMYAFKESSKVRAIRHEIRPSVSINYSPNFNAKNYYFTTIDSSNTPYQYSYYDGSVYGAYSNQRFGGLSFNIDNNISMKIRNKADTTGQGDRKVTIIDGFRLDGSYNFLADSFQLSPLTLSARSSVSEKVNISADATFNPYEVDEVTGRNIDRLRWRRNPFQLGSLVGGSIRAQANFAGGGKKQAIPTTGANPALQNINGSGLAMDEYQREAAYIQNNPGEFADFEIPWQIDGGYSLIFNRLYNITDQRFRTEFTQALNFNSSANLSERWKIGVNGNYNFQLKQLETVSMYLTRDMHCWQMSINVSPVGIYRFFSINLAPKSGLLRDLKINRTRSFYEL